MLVSVDADRRVNMRKGVDNSDSNDLLDGLYCQVCGVVVDGTTPGYPRTCDDCLDREEEEGW